MKQELNNLSKQELVQLILEQGSVVKQQDGKIQKQDNQIQHKDLIIAKLQRMLFGTKSERFIKSPVDPSQLSLSFEELTTKDTEVDDKETVKEKITYQRKKQNHPGRHKLPENLPEKIIIIEPEESTEGLVKIGEQRTEILEITPAKFFKIVLLRPKYAKANEQGIVIGELPSRPIKKCLAGNALLTSLLINKYVDHLPLYRQQQIFKRLGMKIPSSTIDGWIRQLGNLLEPLYDKMVEAIKQDGYIQADETTIKVLDKSKTRTEQGRGKGRTHLGYYWVYHSPMKKMVVFDYQRGRDANAPKKVLENFKGYLQTDGYAVYRQYGHKKQVIHLACWAHIRRKFEEALPQDKSRAEFALGKIQELYAIEREAKEYTVDKRKEFRLERALPIINAIGKWISEENKNILPKSLIGKAFTYAINLWDNLEHYLYNGNLHIDNNLIENSIRPTAVGRKNYLFAGSDNGAQRAAMFYSFLGTCKMNGVNPTQWLEKVLDVIIDYRVNKLYELFPQNLVLES